MVKGMNTVTDHRAFLKSLTPDQQKDLTARSDGRGLIQLALHLGLIGLGGWAILARVPGWPALLVVQGILIVFLFAALHETTHRTAFKTRWLNDAVAKFCGFAIGLPAHGFRFFHFNHHRFTQDPERDPELMFEKPATLLRYLWTVTGLPVWWYHLTMIARYAMGRSNESFIPDSERAAVHREARWMIVGYIGLAAASVALSTTALIWIWIVPLLLGQPFLRLYLMAEHGGCPFVTNMFENTRTTFTNPLVRCVAWNMPYHAEHHAHPGVPFHKLPEFHRLCGPHLVVTERGYIRFHGRTVATMRHLRADG